MRRVLVLILALAGGCSGAPDAPTVPYVAHPLVGLEAQSSKASEIHVLRRGHKVCQLIGDTDLGEQRPVPNATARRAGVVGTDLGISVERNSELVFLFGDTWNAGGLARTSGSDTFATIDARRPLEDACSQLAFAREGADGGFSPITLDGAPLPTFQVPTGVFATPHHLYAFFTVPDAEGRTIGDGGGRGVLARSVGDEHFVTYRDVAKTGERFNMIAAATVAGGTLASLPHPWSSLDLVLMYGTGAYRQSFPRLALGLVNHPDTEWIYFAGWDAAGTPAWSTDEASAMPLFPDDPKQACVGEMSVAWEPHVSQWLMTYNCRGRILLRSADAPWGPWSPSMVLFDKWKDGWQLVHRPCFFQPAPCDDGNYSPGRDDHFGAYERGDVYGPYMVPRWFSSDRAGEAQIAFTMSTWNPYVSVLMQATIAQRRTK